MQQRSQSTEQLTQGVKELQLDIPELSILKLIQFSEILVKWNKAYNLTAIDTPEEILTHHFLDSLSIVPYIHGQVILDLGSGAGFPGIPCALALCDREFILLDSNGKKTRFLTQVIAELKLFNVKVVQERVEKYYPKNCFNTVITRAFSQLDKIISSTRRLLCSNGELLVMKGHYPQAELQNLDNHAKVYELIVPGLHQKRHLISLKGL